MLRIFLSDMFIFVGAASAANISRINALLHKNSNNLAGIFMNALRYENEHSQRSLRFERRGREIRI